MGCSSSTEAGAVAVSTNHSNAAEAASLPEKHHHKKQLTAGTETMAQDEAAEQPSSLSSSQPSSSSSSSGTLSLGPKWKLRYAAATRRGRDPENPRKPNQDAYSIQEQMFHNAHSFFAGVYDGHGPTGELCSAFVQQRLPQLIQRYYDKATLTTQGALDSVMRLAHSDANDELHAKNDINDHYSGTTSISVLINTDEETLTVCNVGDSRAVLGTTLANGQFRAVPLSKDQTPYRKDEALRCQQAGARILSFGELDPSTVRDGDSQIEDPPRVWHPQGKFPGTAFTRSIGDSVAESLGVTAEPEILKVKLPSSSSSVKPTIVVLASDGIYDVLENQQILDVCRSFYQQSPLEACQRVLELSHQEWLLNEDCSGNEEHASYDDMTLVCLFLDRGETQPPTTKEAHLQAAAAPPPTTTTRQQPHHKRVRQKTLRNCEEDINFFGEAAAGGGSSTTPP